MKNTGNQMYLSGAPKPRELPAIWRDAAGHLRAHAAHGAAEAYERAAAQLERSAIEVDEQLLNLKEAAREMGCSTRTLRRRIATGQIRDAGCVNAPKIRRGDLLSHKCGLRKGSGPTQDGETQIEQIARAIVSNRQDGYDG